jgi:hypothetical protein
MVPGGKGLVGWGIAALAGMKWLATKRAMNTN